MKNFYFLQKEATKLINQTYLMTSGSYVFGFFRKNPPRRVRRPALLLFKKEAPFEIQQSARLRLRSPEEPTPSAYHPQKGMLDDPKGMFRDVSNIGH